MRRRTPTCSPATRRTRRDERKKQLRDQFKQQREQAESAQKQLDDVRRSLATRFPAFLALVNPVNPTVDDDPQGVAPGEAFVGLYPTREGTFAWAVNANGKTALAISPWTDADVDARVAALRATLDVGDRLPRLPAMDFAAVARAVRRADPTAARRRWPARRCSTSRPAARSARCRSRRSSPDRPATRRPRRGSSREFAIAQTPGAAAFVTLRGVDAKPSPRALIGFGDPQFGGAAAAARPTGAVPRARNLVVAANAAQASTYSVEKGFATRRSRRCPRRARN